jgi:hypothetical protein
MIREYCRGYRVFYNTFYKRNGGSRTIEEEFVKSSIEYAKTSSRTLVEIKTRKMRKEKSLVDKV